MTYTGCGACGDVTCYTHGCKRYRFQSPNHYPTYYPPMYQPMPAPPGNEVFNTTQEITDLKRRVAELEKKLDEKQ